MPKYDTEIKVTSAFVGFGGASSVFLDYIFVVAFNQGGKACIQLK